MMWALESDGYRSKLKSQGNTDLGICELSLLVVSNFHYNLNMAFVPQEDVLTEPPQLKGLEHVFWSGQWTQWT